MMVSKMWGGNISQYFSMVSRSLP